MTHPFPTALLCAGGLVLGLGAAAFAEPADALPPGPKEVLAEIVLDDEAALDSFLSAEREAEDWLGVLLGQAPQIDETQLRALADYLALNAPVEAEGEDVGARLAGLPMDGKELFLDGCVACHGVESYYLLLDRDFEGWMAVFDAPYHRRLMTGENERETFSSYAAHMMPIPAEDVPEEWREGR